MKRGVVWWDWVVECSVAGAGVCTVVIGVMGEMIRMVKGWCLGEGVGGECVRVGME